MESRFLNHYYPGLKFNVVFILGTHDIQNIIAISPHPGQISIMGNFIDGSIATGVLLIVYSLTNESDIHYHAINKENEKNNNISIKFNVTGLIGTEFQYLLWRIACHSQEW